jgi:hypothetical protein
MFRRTRALSGKIDAWNLAHPWRFAVPYTALFFWLYWRLVCHVWFHPSLVVSLLETSLLSIAYFLGVGWSMSRGPGKRLTERRILRRGERARRESN